MPIGEWRELRQDHPRLQYVPSTASVESLSSAPRKGLHYGQRKLLLSEIEFITLLQERPPSAGVEEKPLLLVYAGAANGSHLPLLFDMFPGVRYVLIDPAPFCRAVQTISQLPKGPVAELINGYCTDELCLRLRRQYSPSYRIALISDIRSGVPEKMTNKEHTEMICRDNKMQASWCVSLLAEAAMLKFHPPYPPCTDRSSRHFDPNDDTPEAIRYLNGRLLFGVWAPKSSSEVRLVITKPFSEDSTAEQREYNCREFEEQLYHYNTNERYAKDVDAERWILSCYIAAREGAVDTAHSTVEKLSRSISAFLGFPLFTPLEPRFTEDDARLVSLLYASRNDDALDQFESLRGKLTRSALISLVERRYGLRSSGGGKGPEQVGWTEDTAGGAETDCMSVGDTKLPFEFWTTIATPKNLSEVYSFPPLRQPSQFVRKKNPRGP